MSCWQRCTSTRILATTPSAIWLHSASAANSRTTVRRIAASAGSPSSAAAHSATCSAESIPKRADAMDHDSRGTLAKFCQKLHHPLMTTMNVSLPETMKRFIDAQVEGRGFGTISEYVRALIRNEQEREQLRELLLAGAASVPAEPADTIWFVPLSLPVTAKERNCPDMRFEQQGLALLSRPVAEAEDRISLNNEVGSMTLQRVR